MLEGLLMGEISSRPGSLLELSGRSPVSRPARLSITILAMQRSYFFCSLSLLFPWLHAKESFDFIALLRHLVRTGLVPARPCRPARVTVSRGPLRLQHQPIMVTGARPRRGGRAQPTPLTARH